MIGLLKARRLQREADFLRANLLRRRLQQKAVKEARSHFEGADNDDTQHRHKREA